MTTANKTVTANINAYILSCIDGEGYGVTLREGDSEAAIKFLRDTFLSEYGHPDNYRRYHSTRFVMAEWFKGLPSSFNIAFTNADILEQAAMFGNLPTVLTEAAEDRIISNWWLFIADATIRLMSRHNIYIPAPKH